MSFADRTPRAARRIAVRAGVAALASAALAAGALALGTSAGASTPGAHSEGQRRAPASYGFTTLNNAHDLTFNQLLGINNNGHIAGYFGSGVAGHPNKGYLLRPPYGSQSRYQNINFPHSVQTQVTGLNDEGVQVGFWSSQHNASLVNNNFGWYLKNGRFVEVNFPTGDPASPPLDQLLGVNNHDVAVGFYTDGQGNNHGYEYNIIVKRFSRVLKPGDAGASLQATAINDRGDVAGIYVTKGGVTDGFLKSGGRFVTLAVRGAAMTQAFGLNNRDEVVGTYTVGTGSNAKTFGFTWRAGHGFTTVSDPHGVGTTFVNGVNNEGDLVGFYTDAAGNVDGMLATPLSRMVEHVALRPMPAGSVSFGRDGGGHLTAKLDTFGLTPGSSHTVLLVGPNGSSQVASFGILTASGVGQGVATLDSPYMGGIPHGSRLVILNGIQGSGVANEPIAETSGLSGTAGGSSITLKALEVSPGGKSYGALSGRATIVFDPGAQTLTVTVDASGLTPGAHAAHIHLGSCTSQGPVLYMLMDLVANGQGRIVNQTRVISGVTTPIPATGWYLNLHQGNSNTILSNGQPTIFFRPLLCSNIS